jgi:hypothetical protein|tara:strand:+ start:261 stop:512 length:252 start_codon:yes stop_codon:yes gene_type:complete
MTGVKCLACGKELFANSAQFTCCGCSNMTSLHGDTVSANDMAKVELLQSNKNVKKASLFSPEELKYQEDRRKRKVRKLTFEDR